VGDNCYRWACDKSVCDNFFYHRAFYHRLVTKALVTIFFVTRAFVTNSLTMPVSPNSTSNLLQAVRAHYGLSFVLLAGYLRVSDSQLRMAATNERDLPTTAWLRLLPLAQALPAPWTPGETEPAPLPDALTPVLAGPLPYPPDPAVLRQRQLSCQYQAQRLARQLGPLQLRQQQARHLLAILPTLVPADARAARYLVLFEAQAQERLGPGPSASLALTQARRYALLGEAAQLAAWLPAE
jgi:hypothetical protein